MSAPAGADTITEFSDRTTFNNTVGVPLTVEDFTPEHHFPLESAFLNSETACGGCGNQLFPGDIQPGVTYFANGDATEPFFFNIDAGGNYGGLGGFLDGFSGSPWFTTQAEVDFWSSAPGNSRLVSAFGFDTAFQGAVGIEVIISFDQGPDQMFSYPVGAGLTFFGFQSDATDISSVIIRNSGGAFFGFDFDNFTFDNRGVGEPVAYCTAKSGLTCGLPAIGFSGTPQAGASSGFTISAAPARNNRAGLILYSCSGPAAIPFQGGLLCVAPAVRRVTPVNSGGGAPCTGVFATDFNAFASGNGGGNPDPCIQMSGQQVNTQYWGRDSIATGSFLSDGLQFDM